MKILLLLALLALGCDQHQRKRQPSKPACAECYIADGEPALDLAGDRGGGLVAVAAGATVAGICEGANRHTAGLKRDALGRARAEVGEAAGHAEALAPMGPLPEAHAARIMALADRVAAMLTRRLQRLQ